MAEESWTQAAGLLIDEAWSAYRAGRYQQALTAADRAAEAAGRLDDPVLLVRALRVQGDTLRLMGDNAAALARYTRIMGLAEDPASTGRLNHPRAAEAVATAYSGWVESATVVTGIPVRDLFRVLDAGDHWLTTTGHRDWRASILIERAMVHHRLGETDAAVPAAEEALATAVRHPDAPGFSLSGIRYQLGDILRNAGKPAEAAPHYQAILDDPDSTTWDRRTAHRGLAQCALETGDSATARRQARTAVLLAEPLGDEALCTGLGVLVDACRADGDLDAAWEAATQYLEAVGRIGGHYRPYFAIRTAVDVALDRADLPAAKRLLGELNEHAAALDAATGATGYTAETARRQQRLADLGQAAP